MKAKQQFYCSLLPLLLTGFISIISYEATQAQSCPPNIDFENGNFDGWTCYTGNTYAKGDENVILLSPSGGPVQGRHTLFSGNTGQTDFYGKFPVLCPNGSGHSIKLGNEMGGNEAEGVSYEFTIPANQNSYSLIYHYAVVFQSPNHKPNEQPRMEIEVTNVTDNTTISCATFTFIAVGSSLPGFLVSDNYGTDNSDVLYKNWSAVSVDLSGNAGKTIKLFFKTADCTFRKHFGYAYIDVNSECDGSFVGATYCPDDTVINVTAPYGYKDYTWYDSTATNIIGTKQILTLSPPPPSGTTLAVKLDPYDGYGCSKTLFTRLKDSLTITAHAVKDALSCNMTPVLLGVNPKPGLRYSWSPPAGLTDPDIANPYASPNKNTSYVVTTTNSGGGCRTTDTVLISTSIIDTSLQLIGKPMYCIDYGDSAVLKVNATKDIRWFKNDIVILRATGLTYRAPSSGMYSALLTNSDGCSGFTRKQNIIIEKAIPGITYPVEYAVGASPLLLKARKIGESALWKPAINLDNPASFTPTFKGTAEQLYTIDIRTIAGCLTVDTQLVRKIKNVEIYVPSAFTPNKDGKNDLLHPILRGMKDVRFFRIYNRWGQLLYDQQNEEAGWDGIYKGIPQQTQAVVWMLEGVGVDGVVYLKKGTSVLLR